MSVIVRFVVAAVVLALLPAGHAAAQNLVASVLPSSRSVQVNATATAFATIINAGPTTATNCRIEVGTTIPALFTYQTTNPATNQVTGTQNMPVSIGAGAAQSFVIAFRPTAAFAPTNVHLNFVCDNAGPATSVTGLNTLLLSASSTPVADVVALGATLSNNGIANVLSNSGVFSVATVNVGATANITATADTGTAAPPVSIVICETSPGSGQCITQMVPSVTTQIAANATPTFGVFVTGAGNVPFDPANNRVFVRFTDSGGDTRGSTSVAVASLPTVVGVFRGSGTLTETSCLSSGDNGTFGFTTTVNVSSQSQTGFGGSANLSASVAGVAFSETLNFTGTIDNTGALSGSFTFTLLANGAFDSRGNGTFTGALSGNTLNINFTSQDTAGDTCFSMGALSAAR